MTAKSVIYYLTSKMFMDVYFKNCELQRGTSLVVKVLAKDFFFKILFLKKSHSLMYTTTFSISFERKKQTKK